MPSTKKFAEAEFSVHHDAGPEDAAFRQGARLTYQEVHYLLKPESIAVDSVLIDTHTRCCHRVIRGSHGRLKLHLPYKPAGQLLWGEQIKTSHLPFNKVELLPSLISRFMLAYPVMLPSSSLKIFEVPFSQHRLRANSEHAWLWAVGEIAQKSGLPR